jgi:protein disulfide-isomerase A1
VPSTENKILDYFGITSAQLPTAVLADLGNEGGTKKYPFTGAMDASTVTSFVQSFVDGTLKPTLKSEEVAADDATGDVVVLRGTSFADLVLNNDKDVLVEFYAPWCGHCKKLAPVWDELGAKFKNNENIVIAKMDSTANEVDVPGLAVKGFPTLVFFKGNDKSNPVKYEEGRELEDIVAFLKKNAHNAATHEEL